MATFYDILLDEDGDLPRSTKHSRGWLAVVQRVQFRLQTFEGEWLLDTDSGLPYLRWRQLKAPNRQEMGLRIQQEILGTPGVIRLVSFASKFLTEEQRIQFDIEIEVADIEDESVITGVQFFPFGPATSNTNPIALIVGPSKTVL